MDRKEEVEVELEEMTKVEEELETKVQLSSPDTMEEDSDANIYHTLAGPSENVYGVKSSTGSYTVKKDTLSEITRRFQLHRIISLVLFVICILLLFAVFALIVKYNAARPEQDLLSARRPLSLCAEDDEGWSRFENSWYFFSNERQTWQGSRDECQKKGGDLAIIANDRVQKVLTEKGNMHYWIGLKEGANGWMWVNNTVLRKSYWKDGFPDGDCAVLDSDKPIKKNWRTSTCSIYLYYICQKM